MLLRCYPGVRLSAQPRCWTKLVINASCWPYNSSGVEGLRRRSARGLGRAPETQNKSTLTCLHNTATSLSKPLTRGYLCPLCFSLTVGQLHCCKGCSSAIKRFNNSPAFKYSVSIYLVISCLHLFYFYSKKCEL